MIADISLLQSALNFCMCRISIRYGCFSIFQLSHCFKQFITSLYAASLSCFLISTQNNKGNGYKYINWIKPTGVSEKWLVNRGVRPSGSSSSVGFYLFTDVSGQPIGAHLKGSSNPKTLTYRRTLGTNPVKKDLKYRAAVAWKLVRLCFVKLYMLTVSGMSSVSYRCNYKASSLEIINLQSEQNTVRFFKDINITRIRSSSNSFY